MNMSRSAEEQMVSIMREADTSTVYQMNLKFN